MGLVWAFAATALAQSTVLNYSGRISVNGAPFNGAGFFTFSIQETNGVIWWRSGDLPFEGSTNLPPGALKLAVKDGVYDIRLGDTAQGMPPLDLVTLRRAISPRLRIWFNGGTNSWRIAGEDVPLADALAAAFDPKAAPMSSAQAEALLTEIRQLRALYERQGPSPVVAAEPAAAPTATISIKDCPSLGRADAPLVLVEFTDFECPFCKEAHQTALSGLKKKYVETGKLRLVMRNLALPFHSHAEPAARAALCAGQQEKFWPMHDKLFAISPALTTTNFLKAAEDLKLDLEVFRACLEGNAPTEQIKKDGKDAATAGIQGTPTFVLGKPDGEHVTGEILVGAQSFAFFDKEIQKRLGP
jgi:protein-disulfide isomerase